MDIASKTILLVEDELIIAMNETEILENYGYSVVTVTTAEEAVETVERDGVDLILMDIDLGAGRMDGTRAAQEILKTKELPIVFLTSHAEKEMVDRVKGITRYGYVLKNSGEFVLLEAITMAFELFEAHTTLKTKEIESREIVDNLDCAVIKYNEDGGIFFFNKGAEKIFGYTAEEVCGTTGVGLINPPIDSTGVDHREMLRDIFMHTDTYLYNENENVCKDGSTVWMAWRNKAVFNSNGKKLYVQSIGNDITELRSTIRKLEKSEHRYRSLFHSIRDAIYIHRLLPNGELGCFEQVNNAAKEMLGYSDEEFCALSPADLDDPEAFPEYAGNVIDSLRERGNVVFDAVQIAKDGTKVPVEVNANLVIRDGQEYIISVCRKRTEK